MLYDKNIAKTHHSVKTLQHRKYTAIVRPFGKFCYA